MTKNKENLNRKLIGYEYDEKGQKMWDFDSVLFLGAVEVKIVKCFMSEINSLLYKSLFMELL